MEGVFQRANDAVLAFEGEWTTQLDKINNSFVEKDNAGYALFTNTRNEAEQQTRLRIEALNSQEHQTYRQAIPGVYEELRDLLIWKKHAVVREAYQKLEAEREKRLQERTKMLERHEWAHIEFYFEIQDQYAVHVMGKREQAVTGPQGQPIPQGVPLQPAYTLQQTPAHVQQPHAQHPQVQQPHAQQPQVQQPQVQQSHTQQPFQNQANYNHTAAMRAVAGQTIARPQDELVGFQIPRVRTTTDNPSQKRSAEHQEAPVQKRARVSAGNFDNIGVTKALAPPLYPFPQDPRRMIRFADVYGKGNPEYKHLIVNFPQGDGGPSFFILQCVEHKVHFGLSPIQGGAKHLHSAAHSFMHKIHALAIQQLGYRIVDCTEELAMMNNEMVKKAHAEGYTPLNKKRVVRPAEYDPVSGKNVPSAKPFAGRDEWVTRPAAGGILFAETREVENGPGVKYAVMVLDWDSQERCGLPGKTLQSLGLLQASKIPSCYVLDAENKKIIGWARGYEEGGPYEHQRVFPIYWFTDSGEMCTWIQARWLSQFVLDPTNVLHVKARDFRARGQGHRNYEDMRNSQTSELFVEKEKSDARGDGPGPTAERRTENWTPTALAGGVIWNPIRVSQEVTTVDKERQAAPPVPGAKLPPTQGFRHTGQESTRGNEVTGTPNTVRTAWNNQHQALANPTAADIARDVAAKAYAAMQPQNGQVPSQRNSPDPLHNSSPAGSPHQRLVEQDAERKQSSLPPRMPSTAEGKHFDVVAYVDSTGNRWQRQAGAEPMRLTVTNGIATARRAAALDVAIQPERVRKLWRVETDDAGLANTSRLKMVLTFPNQPFDSSTRTAELLFESTAAARSEVQARSMLKWVVRNNPGATIEKDD